MSLCTPLITVLFIHVFVHLFIHSFIYKDNLCGMWFIRKLSTYLSCIVYFCLIGQEDKYTRAAVVIVTLFIYFTDWYIQHKHISKYFILIFGIWYYTLIWLCNSMHSWFNYMKLNSVVYLHIYMYIFFVDQTLQ